MREPPIAVGPRTLAQFIPGMRLIGYDGFWNVLFFMLLDATAAI